MANTPDANRARRKNFAYAPTTTVSDWRLPIYDAEHVRLAVAAVGPHPPHGNPPDIPADAMSAVRQRIAAAVRKHIADPAERDTLLQTLFGHREGELTSPPAPLSQKAGEGEPAANPDLAPLSPRPRVPAKALFGFRGMGGRGGKGLGDRGVSLTAVKALPDGRIGGYLVVFGSPRQRDLQGEYFTPQTDFALDWSDQRPVLYHHGLDAKAATALVGTIDTLQADDIGLWAEAQLNKRSAFVKKIEELIAAGALSWSSGSLGHLVRKDRDGRITRWPLIEGSLTPTPAEPRLTHVTHLAPAKTIEAAYKSLGLPTDFLTPLSPAPFPPRVRGERAEETRFSTSSPSPSTESGPGGEVNQPADHLYRSEANEDNPMTDGATTQSTGTASPAIDPGAIQAAVSAALAEAFSNSPRLSEVGTGPALSAGQRAAKTLPSPQSAHSPHVTVIVDGKTPRISMMKDRRFEDWTAADMAFFHTMLSDLNARQPLGAKTMNRIAQRFLSEVHSDPDHKFEREMAHKAHREIAAKRLSEAEAELILSMLPYKSVEAVWANDYQAIKANELDTTTQAGFGQEYVPTIWRDTIWARIRIANAVAQNMVAVNMPTNPFYIALEQADPTIYYVGETTDAASLVYNASNAISLSKIASAKATLTAKKLAGRVGFSMELSEDALPFLIPQYRYQLIRSMQNAIDNSLLNGDVATAANTNINLIDGTPPAAPTAPNYLAFDGLLKYCLVTNTGQSASAGGGAPTMALLRQMRKGLLNAYAMDMNNLVYVVDVPTYFKMIAMPEYATWQALGMNGANVTGLLPGGSADQVGTAARPVGYIDNIPVFVSAEMGLANANGKVSGTPANNTLGRAVLYHKNRWFLGIKRDVDFEAASLPLLSDVQLMQVTARCTVASFDATSAFVLFNIGV